MLHVCVKDSMWREILKNSTKFFLNWTGFSSSRSTVQLLLYCSQHRLCTVAWPGMHSDNPLWWTMQTHYEQYLPVMNIIRPVMHSMTITMNSNMYGQQSVKDPYWFIGPRQRTPTRLVY
jgi:hypothetical protein